MIPRALSSCASRGSVRGEVMWKAKVRKSVADVFEQTFYRQIRDRTPMDAR